MFNPLLVFFGVAASFLFLFSMALLDKFFAAFAIFWPALWMFTF